MVPAVNPDSFVPVIGVTFDNAGGNPFYALAIKFQPTWTTTEAQWNAAGTTHNTLGTDISASVNAEISLAAAVALGGGGNMYFNGVVGSTGTGSAGQPSFGTSPLVVIGEDGSNGRAPNAISNMALFYNRLLSGAEIAFLDQNPYCFLLPAEGEMPALFLASGGGAARTPTLTLMGVG